MKFVKILLFTLLVCIASYCRAQDTIVLNTNYVSICTVQKFRFNYLTIKGDPIDIKIKYSDIKSIKLKNIECFEKIISLTPKAQPIIVYPINYKTQQEAKALALTKNKQLDSIVNFNYNLPFKNQSSEYYFHRAGKKLVTSGVCILIGGYLTSTALLLPNTKDIAPWRGLMIVTSSAMYLTSTITLISGGVNLKRAAKAKPSRLSYRLSPASGALCLSF